MKLWKQGENVYLSGQQEDGSHTQTKYFRKEEYLPVNTLIELDSREFRVDSVNFKQGTVSLQDMTLAKEARYPIFRTEPLEYIRHLYEQQMYRWKKRLKSQSLRLCTMLVWLRGFFPGADGCDLFGGRIGRRVGRFAQS